MTKKETNTQKKQILIIAQKKHYLIIILFILIVLLAIAIIIHVTNAGKKNIITSSTLTRAIPISELSTARFTYNGIAEIYDDEEQSEVKCHIRYNATVKAGIDIKSVNLDNINHDNKTIKPILPEINITSVNIDEKSLSFIPKKVDVTLKEVLIACQNDVLNESKNSSALLDSAENNLKLMIEAFIFPIAISQNYKIIWD